MSDQQLKNRTTYGKAINGACDYSPYATRRIREWDSYVLHQFCPIGNEDHETKAKLLLKEDFGGIKVKTWDPKSEQFAWVKAETQPHDVKNEAQ